ncbi:MAG: magnesium transporter CorA family protein [Anaerolineales bacterium]|nr:magnesium transporter CorA family protein [Anaerolineales bacterium]
MITIYKNTEVGLSILTEPIDGCWINVTDPTAEEIHWLESLGIPQDYITYPLDLDERARTERENGELLIVLRIPFFQGRDADVPYITIPMGIILNKSHLVSICKLENEIINEFISGRVRNLETAKRNRFILRLLLHTANKYLTYLRDIDKVVDFLEDQLQRSTRNKEVLELLKYQKSLTYFTTALKTNELMLERLQRSQIFKAYPDDEDLLEDVITENQQAIEMTNIASNILSSMMDAFASIISNNLNVVMKFLASVTIVLSLPTLVASFYGMNVNLPLEGHPNAFLLILAMSLLLSLTVVYIFNKKDWL